jgi:hypothetical protein
MYKNRECRLGLGPAADHNVDSKDDGKPKLGRGSLKAITGLATAKKRSGGGRRAQRNDQGVIVAVGIDGVDCDPVKVGERTALCFEQPGAPLHEGGRNGAYFQVMS